MLRFHHDVTISAPAVEAALNRIGELLVTINEDLQTAFEQDKADSALVIQRLAEFTTTVHVLVQKIDDLTAGGAVDVEAIRGVITQLNSEHEAVQAALSANPSTLPPEGEG